jgi:hypothetical protein
MAANTSPIFELTPYVKGLQFTSADTTTKKTLVATGDIPAEGLRVDAITVTSNDTASVTLLWYVNDGTTDFHLGDTVIALSSGYDAVARVNVLATIAAELGFLILPTGYSLKAACKVTMTSAKTLDIVALGGKFA